MSDITYRQCALQRPVTGEIDVAWLPTQFAQRGKWLRIGDFDGWQVTAVYTLRTLTAEDIVLKRSELRRFQYVLPDRF